MSMETRERRIRAFWRVLPWSNKAKLLAAVTVQEVGVGALRISKLRPWAMEVEVFHLVSPAPSVVLVSGLKLGVIVRTTA